MEELLSITQAADRKGVKRQTIFIAIKTGRLPATRIGNAWVMRPGDVDALEVAPPNGQRSGVRLGPRKKITSDSK